MTATMLYRYLFMIRFRSLFVNVKWVSKMERCNKMWPADLTCGELLFNLTIVCISWLMIMHAVDL